MNSVQDANLDVSDLNAQIDAIPEVKEGGFDVDLFQHLGRKSVNLINNNDPEFFIKSKNVWFSFDFKRALYVKKIIVKADGFDDFNELELSFDESFTGVNTKKKSKYDSESGAFVFSVSSFLSGFGILPDPKYFTKPRINSIEVYGFEEESFRRALQFFENVEAAREKLISKCESEIGKATQAQLDLESLNEQIEQADEDVSGKKSEIDGLSASIRKLSEEKGNVETNISALKITQQQLTDRITSLEGNIEAKKSDQSEISQQVSESVKRLRQLENDINLFPTEISDYISQGSKNIKTYLIIGFVPLLIISVLTYRLIVNSEQIVDFYAHNEQINILEFLLSRLPYVIVSVVILGVCYTFIHRIISEIININRRRQDLYKISIIATDASFASESDLNLSD